MSWNPFNKKPQKQTVKRPKGFKVVPPPENMERRRLMEGDDIRTSGGCRSAHQPVH